AVRGDDDTAVVRAVPGEDDTQPVATPSRGPSRTAPAERVLRLGKRTAPAASEPGDPSASRRMQAQPAPGMPAGSAEVAPAAPPPEVRPGGPAPAHPGDGLGAAPGARPRVVVANRGGGGILYWLGRLYGFAALALVATLGVAGVAVYSYFSLHAPAVPDLERYAHVTPGVSRIYAADGTVIGQYAKEWRQLVPFERIPQRLVDAFLAVEDHEFFEHKGIYFKGIARAVWRNITAGDFAQGGSTITQQVAKQFLGSEKSLSRKGKEAIVARRLEARYSKRAILAVYLNHIYLGAGAWGVSAAARRYFDKELDQITLAEAALIAGLAKAPTRFSPQNQPKLALERRNVVLDKMAAYGFARAEEVTAAKAEPIRLDMQHAVYADRLPYYGTYVRNQLANKLGEQAIRDRGLAVSPARLAEVRRALGEEQLGERGLQVETAAEPAWEAAAYDNADYGARNQDKRQGWRGPEWRVDGTARALFIERQKQLYGTGPLVPGKRYLALVDKVAPDNAEVIVGDRRLQLPLRNLRWASKWQPGNQDNDVQIDAATAALRPGYVVWVRREQRTVLPFRSYTAETKNPIWIAPDDQHAWDEAHADVVRLEQVPHPQTAIFTADHRTGYVAAMVGGSDYDRSVFNRTVQACRQPGSTYKPIYYSLALDQGYGFDTRLNDVPMTIIDPVTGEKWTPTNLNDTLDNDVTLEYALVFSKNVPSLDLFLRLKAPNVEAWARRLGFSTKIYADEALALGASCSKLDEMARAFSVFARNGSWWSRPAGQEKSWVYVRRILDREGNAVEDNTVAEDPQLPAGDRIDRIAMLAGITAPPAIPSRAAYLMSKLLANEVTYGFANVLRETKLNAAGKTGTSSATHDTLFIAYTSQWTTLVWMGDDKKERALGRWDAAYITVVPLWSRYMYEAARGYPNPMIPWAIPPGVKAGDRGDHTKGEKVPPMDLLWKIPQKPDTAGDDRPPV
ncbi:MAG TPA: transglycosylase domain-containing protein, partial [Kofleriaceae bacterium]|nr:transglycosylase domain-containing protein [Kofleriaceae bacterium]